MDTRVKRSEFFSFFLRFFPPSSSSSSSFRLGSVLEMGVRVYEGVYTRRFEIFFGAKGATPFSWESRFYFGFVYGDRIRATIYIYMYVKAIHRDGINLFQEFDLIIKLKYS